MLSLAAKEASLNSGADTMEFSNPVAVACEDTFEFECVLGIRRRSGPVRLMALGAKVYSSVLFLGRHNYDLSTVFSITLFPCSHSAAVQNFEAFFEQSSRYKPGPEFRSRAQDEHARTRRVRDDTK